MKKYRILCERIAPPRKKREGVEGKGTLEFRDSDIVVDIKDVQENLWFVSSCLGTILTVLLLLPLGWDVARYGVISWVLWFVVLGVVLGKRREFLIDSKHSKVYCMMYSNPTSWRLKHLMIFIELTNGKWLGIDVPDKRDRNCVMKQLRNMYGDRMHCEGNVQETA